MSYPEAVPCVSCGETVGKYALTCPHCGTNYANRLWGVWVKKWVIGALVLLIVIALGALFNRCSDRGLLDSGLPEGGITY